MSALHNHPHVYTEDELESLRIFFVRMAGEAEGPGWMDLYLDAADALGDVVSAWKGEIEP